jgi:tetratricopeptide (TPR) repeat protein
VTTPSDIKTFRPSAPPVSKADARRQQLKRRLAGRAMAELLSRRSKIPEAVSNVEKSLADAELAMDQDRYSDAANLARSILKHYPDNEKAKQLLKDAGKGLSQTQVRLHMRRSLYARRDGQPEQAKWHLEQALVIDPNHIDARHMLAELFFEAGDVQRALSLMKEVIVLGGQRARYFVTLGEIFLAIEDLERASDAFNRALSLEPDNRDIKKRLKSCNR